MSFNVMLSPGRGVSCAAPICEVGLFAVALQQTLLDDVQNTTDDSVTRNQPARPTQPGQPIRKRERQVSDLSLSFSGPSR